MPASSCLLVVETSAIAIGSARATAWSCAWEAEPTSACAIRIVSARLAYERAIACPTWTVTGESALPTTTIVAARPAATAGVNPAGSTNVAPTAPFPPRGGRRRAWARA